jgi:phosphopantetheinyl transferase (holo-ACP synthase)
MIKPITRIHNQETNEVIDREMTDEEFEAYKLDKIAVAELAKEKEAKEAAKAALLAKLGITAEEASLLLS